MRRFRNTIVVGEDVDGGFHHFKPATRDEALMRLAKEMREVFDGSLNAAGMDEIKWLGEVPRKLEVVDLKDTIRWNPDEVILNNPSHFLYLKSSRLIP